MDALQSDLDYIFQIRFETIEKILRLKFMAVWVFYNIFFQGHLRLFLPLPVCYNKMVKKIHMHEEWQSRHRSKHEYVIGPFKKYYPTRSYHFFTFFKRIFLRSNSVSGFQKFIYYLPRTQSENIKYDTKWWLYV